MIEYCAGLDVASFSRLPVWTRIVLSASDLLGWHYAASDGNHFPAARPSLPAKLVRPRVGQQGIDCSTMTSWMVISAFPSAAWTDKTYADLQIFDGKRPWSPIDGIVAAGAGRALTGDPQEGQVLLLQGWTSLSPLYGGHARIVRITNQKTLDLEILESSSIGRRVDSPGGVGVGPMRAFTTWADLQKRYRAGMRGAILED